MEIITRAEAKKHGLGKYFTGKPCPNGHIAYRLVSNYNCIKCIRDRPSAKKRQSNRDHDRAYSRYLNLQANK